MHAKLIQLQSHLKTSSLTKLDFPILKQHQIELWLKRDDLIDPVISGNKWRKLKYILNHALNMQVDTIISMGGAYSNHLHALAYAGHKLGLKTRGIIRGERPAVLNPSLLDMINWGMELEFVSRAEFRRFRNYKHYQSLPGIQASQYWLPEGGSTRLALRGVAELVDEINGDYDYITVPCGTGTTLAGIVKSIRPGTKAIGFSALKGGGFLTDDVIKLTDSPLENWHINIDYHFGGFAKTTEELLAFINQFQQQSGIILEPVYTGKMLYAVFDLIEKQYFQPGSKIIAIHTGGLQGKRGFNSKFLKT